jgi:hypothetical protein
MDLTALRRKARYGHRSYLYWHNASGELQFAPYGKSGLKRAILDVGVRGRFFWYNETGVSHIARSFSFMIHLWRCAR